jgi:hypothetical protein
MLNLQRGFDAKDITGFFRCHRSVCLLVFFYNAVKSYMFSRKKSLSKECSICREDLMRRTSLDSLDAIDPYVCLFSFIMAVKSYMFSRKKSLSKECSICREDLMRRTLPDSLDAIDPSVCLLVFLSMKGSNVLAKGIMLILLIGYRCEDHGFLILDFNRPACLSVFVLLCSERAMYSRTKRSQGMLKAWPNLAFVKLQASVVGTFRAVLGGYREEGENRFGQGEGAGGSGQFSASESALLGINQDIIRIPPLNTQAIPIRILGPGENQSGYHPDPNPNSTWAR